MSEGTAAAFGFIIASAIWFGFFSVSFRNWHERYTAAEATIVNRNETIRHLEAQKSPTYQIPAYPGADPVARRNVLTDVEEFEEADLEPWSEEETVETIRIAEQDLWDTALGGYRGN